MIYSKTIYAWLVVLSVTLYVNAQENENHGIERVIDNGSTEVIQQEPSQLEIDLIQDKFEEILTSQEKTGSSKLSVPNIEQSDRKHDELADLAHRQTFENGSNVVTSTGDFTKKLSLPIRFCQRRGRIDCPVTSIRSINGSCNNLDTWWWGMAGTPYRRLLSPDYDDYVSEPRMRSVNRRRDLPNARTLAIELFDSIERSSTWSHFMAFYSQFIEQDLYFTDSEINEDGSRRRCRCSSRNSDCFNIAIPRQDNINVDSDCMSYVRSRASTRQLDCSFGPREQTNMVTHWLDLSQLYGSNDAIAKKLRTFTGGAMKSSGDQKLPFRTDSTNSVCRRKRQPYAEDYWDRDICYLSGDGRTEDNVFLSGINTIWLREHNRIAFELAKLSPNSTDEQLYQTTRHIVIAEYQHIVFKEFLPSLLSTQVAESFNLLPEKRGYFDSYDGQKAPQISNEFASAAFRYANNLIKRDALLTGSGNRRSKYEPIENLLFNNRLYDTSMENVLKGALIDWSNKPDGHMNKYFLDWYLDKMFSRDSIRWSVPALEIQRGRDHGIPSYIEYRTRCGLRDATNFEDLTNIPERQIRRLRRLYASPRDIDLYVGLLSERPIRGSQLGHTAACIVAKQFKSLKTLDRLYYENRDAQFTSKQLAEIRRTSKMARILCQNLAFNSVQKNPFFVSNSEFNPQVDCRNIKPLNLTRFLAVITNADNSTSFALSLDGVVDRTLDVLTEPQSNRVAAFSVLSEPEDDSGSINTFGAASSVLSEPEDSSGDSDTFQVAALFSLSLGDSLNDVASEPSDTNNTPNSDSQDPVNIDYSNSSSSSIDSISVKRFNTSIIISITNSTNTSYEGISIVCSECTIELQCKNVSNSSLQLLEIQATNSEVYVDCSESQFFNITHLNQTSTNSTVSIKFLDTSEVLIDKLNLRSNYGGSVVFDATESNTLLLNSVCIESANSSTITSSCNECISAQFGSVYLKSSSSGQISVEIKNSIDFSNSVNLTMSSDGMSSQVEVDLSNSSNARFQGLVSVLSTNLATSMLLLPQSQSLNISGIVATPTNASTQIDLSDAIGLILTSVTVTTSLQGSCVVSMTNLYQSNVGLISLTSSNSRSINTVDLSNSSSSQITSITVQVNSASMTIIGIQYSKFLAIPNINSQTSNGGTRLIFNGSYTTNLTSQGSWSFSARSTSFTLISLPYAINSVYNSFSLYTYNTDSMGTLDWANTTNLRVTNTLSLWALTSSIMNVNVSNTKAYYISQISCTAGATFVVNSRRKRATSSITSYKAGMQGVVGSSSGCSNLFS